MHPNTRMGLQSVEKVHGFLLSDSSHLVGCPMSVPKKYASPISYAGAAKTVLQNERFAWIDSF